MFKTPKEVGEMSKRRRVTYKNEDGSITFIKPKKVQSRWRRPLYKERVSIIGEPRLTALDTLPIGIALNVDG